MAAAGDRALLGPVALLALGLNGIVGVGIFFLPRDVAGLVPGPAGVGVYALTALALLPMAAVYATLGGRFAEDGGPYVWARAAFGGGVAFVVGWVAWVSAVLSTAAVVVGLAETAAAAAAPGHAPLVAQGVAGLVVGGFGAVAALGLRPSAIAWTVVTVAKLLPLALLVAVGLGQAPAAPVAPAAGAAAGPAVFRAALVVVFALQGFEIVAVPAGQSRRGGAGVPMATVGSLAAAALLYAAVHWVAVRGVPELGGLDRPLERVGAALGGPPLGAAVGLGSAVSAAGIAFGMIVMTPRYLAALGRPDGLGAWLGREGAGQVPRRALAVTLLAAGLLAFAALAAGAGVGLRELFVLSSVMVLLQYAVSAAALLGLGLTSRAGLRPRDAWPVPLAAVTLVAIGAAATARELAVAAVAVAAGLVVPLGRRLRAARGGGGGPEGGAAAAGRRELR